MEQEIQPQPQQPINPIPLPARKINKKIIVIVVLVILAIVIGYYGYRTFTVHYDKLGELSFYKDANMELKVILTHENLPFHYVGNSYSVACQSQNTQAPSNDEYEWKFDRIEKGWNATPQAYLGNGLGSDSNTLLKSLSEEAKKLYLVKDKNTLVILANPNVYISFDGCRTFNNWVLKDNISPDLLVESTPEFEKCVEQQKKDKELGLTSYGNCSDLKLTGKGQPAFQNVVANDNGHASFKVTSSAFKDNKVASVESKDFGKTWQTTTMTIDTVNGLPVEIQSNSLFMDWYKSKQQRYTDINSFSHYLTSPKIGMGKQKPYNGESVCNHEEENLIVSPDGKKILCISYSLGYLDLSIYDKVKSISGTLQSCSTCSEPSGFWLDNDKVIFLSNYKDDEFQIYKEFIVVQEFDFGKDRSDSWSAGVKND